jgi:hypothetical protein
MVYLKHGQSGGNNQYARSKLYTTWADMRKRCNNPNYKEYEYYGGRGIKVCERWNEFINFAADMGQHPGKGWSLDRIDNNEGYHPDNCRWATPAMQSKNRRSFQKGAKLTREQATEIREQYASGNYTIQSLADVYFCSSSQIQRIVTMQQWV